MIDKRRVKTLSNIVRLLSWSFNCSWELSLLSKHPHWIGGNENWKHLVDDEGQLITKSGLVKVCCLLQILSRLMYMVIDFVLIACKGFWGDNSTLLVIMESSSFDLSFAQSVFSLQIFPHACRNRSSVKEKFWLLQHNFVNDNLRLYLLKNGIATLQITR